MAAYSNRNVSKRKPSDDYEIIQKVGSGTYGDVYKARILGTNDYAAIKIVKLEPNDDFVSLQKEILMMKECRHPNIVAFFSSYIRKDRLSICMEYCGGGSLQDIYQLTGPLSENHISFICREVLKGLQYLHSMGKIHRDVKGANILLTEEGGVKLADFGVSAEITATINKRRSVIGTPYWMAPEVAAVMKKGGYDQQCDIWAVGITAIELAEKNPPMYELHPMRALILMSKSKFKPPELKDKTKWSIDFRTFVKYALTKNPKKRPTAERLLFHSFVNKDLDKRLMKDLIEKARNHSMSYDDLDDDISETLPRRIQSKNSWKDKRAQWEVESVNFEFPLVTELSANDSQNAPTNLCRAWGINGLSEEDFEHSTWMENEVKDQVIKNILSPYSKRLEKFGNKRSLLEIVDEELIQRGHKGSLTEYSSQATLPIEKSENKEFYKEEKDDCPVDDSSDYKTPPTSPSTEKPKDINISKDIATRENTHTDTPPSAPPRRKSNLLVNKNSSIPPRATSNGLPPTPKVHMGACFSKVFNECPLNINCSVSWIHPETRNQHIILGCDEGIYTLNLNELHDACLDRLYPRKTTWLFVIKDIMMSLSGKTSHLYRHDLVSLHSRIGNKFSNQMDSVINKIPERFVPSKLVATSKVSLTKGCNKCCVGRNPYNGYKYLCGVTSSGIFLMQWYNPMNKFMLIKQFEIILPSTLEVFEMIITPDSEYPLLCIGVKKSYDPTYLKLDIVNLNTTTNWFSDCFVDENGTKTIISQHNKLNIVDVKQLDKDTILVCHDKFVKLVNLDGKLKWYKKKPIELTFDFPIVSIVCLTDSVLAFHIHGMQGRSFKNNEVVQEIVDGSRIFRILGADRIISLESKPTDDPNGASCLYILAGHENSY